MADQTTDMPDGFYWIMGPSLRGGNDKPMVAELSNGEWFLPGYEGGDPPGTFYVLSGRIAPPQGGAKPGAAVTYSPRLQALMDEAWFQEAVGHARQATQILADHAVGVGPEGGACITLAGGWFLSRVSDPMPRMGGGE